MLLALVSLPMIVFFLSYHKIKSKTKKTCSKYFLTLDLELFCNNNYCYGNHNYCNFLINIFPVLEHIPIHNYGYDVFLLFSSFSPVLLILIFFCFPVKLLTNRIIARILKLKQNWRWSSDSLNLSEESHRFKSRKIRLVYLLIFVLFSISLALLPQLPPINKDNQQIGTDSDFYVEYISHLAAITEFARFLKNCIY